VFGTDDPALRESLDGLAELFKAQGRYAEAELLFRRALGIAERVLGPEHPDVVTALDGVASLYEDVGKYAEAEALYNRSLTITEKVYRPEHPKTAVSFSNLAKLYLDEGKYADAKASYEQSLAINTKALGPRHLSVATNLDCLGQIALLRGEYPEAERLFNQSLDIRKHALGPQHPEVGQSFNNLAEVYRAEGLFMKAEQLYGQALLIAKTMFGRDKYAAGNILNNLALLKQAQEKYSEAEALFRSALIVAEKVAGPESMVTARFYNNLGTLFVDQERYADAEEMHKRALAIMEKVSGEDHPDLARSFNNLAMVYWAEDKYEDAEELLKRAMVIWEKTWSPDQPFINGPMVNLAGLYSEWGRPEQADQLYDRSLSNFANVFDYLFPFMAETERLSFLHMFSGLFPDYYSFCFRYAKQNPQLIGKMYDVALWQKGLVGRSMAAARAKLAARDDKEALGLLEKLTTMKSRLASLLLSQRAEKGQWKEKVDRLAKEVDEIEKELAKKSNLLPAMAKAEKITWRDVQTGLKPGEAAVELLRFPFSNVKHAPREPYYVALVITSETRTAPTLIFIGNAKDIEDVPLMKYRDLSSEHPLAKRTDGSVYRSIWKPLDVALGGVEKIYISPDGILNLISFPVIPLGDGRRLIDKYDVRVVSSTKDLLRNKQSPTGKSAVLIGDPKFDLSEAQQRVAVAKASRDATNSGPEVAGPGTVLRSDELRIRKKLIPLPATKLEIANIRAIFEKESWLVDTFTEGDATEEAIQRVKGPRVLHVATHAFFLSDQQNLFSRPANFVIRSPEQLPLGFDDPMLRSGLFFAGANRALQGQRPAQDLEDGILTAYEATDLNLQGTELVVLSACVTGLGRISNGEGVFGLRRALNEAGAHAVLMSLWAVPDRETQELMTLFYSKWLAGEDKHQALRDAEIELRATVKARYGEDRPFYWGGFVLEGQ